MIHDHLGLMIRQLSLEIDQIEAIIVDLALQGHEDFDELAEQGLIREAEDESFTSGV